ncbi:MAG: PHB depolymerase family esterase [Ottowia sp.]|nr:PHB depolymerase family esterase [Ottowia sp.]
MNPQFQQHMAEATRLTRLGDVAAATALIQAALGGVALAGTPADATAAARTSAAGSDVIDVVARVVPPPQAPVPVPVLSMPAGPFARAGAAPDGARVAADAPQRPAARTAPDAQPGREPARFVAGRFQHPTAGARDYKLFLPPGAGEQPRPLVLMLHGCTQTPDDFAAGTRMNEAAAAQGVVVLYPAQSVQMNPQRCWNWFKRQHQQRDRGEPALLAALVRQVVADQRIDPSRVYVAGLSAGGAMAAVLGQAYPDLFAAVGVHSGLASGVAGDLPSALAAMQSGAPAPRASRPVPTIVFHGDRDATVNPANGAQVFAAATPPGATAHTERIARPGARAHTRQQQRDAHGRVVAEHWLVHGAAHAWSGGSSAGSYTDPQGPDATREMLRFFLSQRNGGQ